MNGMTSILRRRWVVGVLNLGAVLWVYFALPTESGQAPAELALRTLLALVGAGVLVVLAIRALRAETDQGENRVTLVRLGLVIEVVLLLFALTYYVLAGNAGTQFTGIETKIDALYFTIVTTTTTGYGDIAPVGQFARVVVTLHLLFNVVLIGALVNAARLRFGR